MVELQTIGLLRQSSGRLTRRRRRIMLYSFGLPLSKDRLSPNKVHDWIHGHNVAYRLH